MVLYTCSKYYKQFNKKSSYDYHVYKRKHPCVYNYEPNEQNTIPPKSRKKAENMALIGENNMKSDKVPNLICAYCHQTFTRKDNLIRHMKDRCKAKKHKKE